MAGPSFVAVDLGASSGRAMLGTLEGGKLSLRELHRFANGPLEREDGLHWDAPRLLAEIEAALRRCAAEGIEPAGVGIDTWGVDYGLLDDAGELIGLPYHYRDQRTVGQMERVLAHVPREELYARTGTQFMPLNTLYQLMADRAARDGRLERAATLLMMPDLLGYWLTGERRSEHSVASTSQCYDVAGGMWTLDLAERLGLPAGIFPPVARCATPLGKLRAEIQRETGLGAVPVIQPAGHDTACAVAAVPAAGEDWAYVSCGTWSLIGVELERPIRTAEAMDCEMTNEGGVEGTVRFLRNVTGLWLIQECQRVWAEQGRRWSFEELDQAAEEAMPLAALIDPDDPRFAAPRDMPAAMRAYVEQTRQRVPENEGDLMRCALDSLALKCRVVLDGIERLTGRAIRVVHLVGGGVRNELLCQLTADATGREVLAGPVEATAAGNALLQAMAVGQIGSRRELREIVRRSWTVRRYEPRDTEAWNEGLERFETIAARVRCG